MLTPGICLFYSLSHFLSPCFSCLPAQSSDGQHTCSLTHLRSLASPTAPNPPPPPRHITEPSSSSPLSPQKKTEQEQTRNPQSHPFAPPVSVTHSKSLTH
ncbi:uncharacterized protein K452DRAFT_166084 [Aplosporella prunicola CBS 121167]|uniref:REJ domain-containing protein n=1 Tax=Aplosporella prunicola CBS 121167 TaxID=1176127 RepID=A0A6A6AXK3_9PEZI|nr:uncharacterized protein K452DRAFT_166084 [Aplosporella prunicola CBS 121167]KAF2135674.1 hypothetical protein K452DRAFT_166084 [Aplosporella prunicola CBS 121167]